MKKFFTLFAAVLMAASMMAVDMTFESAGFRGYDYYEDEGEGLFWALTWRDQSMKSKVNLKRTTNLDNKYGHFTTADFDLSSGYSTIYIWGDDEYYLTAVDVTLTKTETGLTMTGYVVGTNGVTYNLNGTYSAPAGVASKTTFSTLADLEGMTVTFAGEMPEFNEYFSILFKDSAEKIVYDAIPAEGGVLFSNNVLTINSFDSEYSESSEYSLPTEEMDLTIVLVDAFDGYVEVTAGSIHFNPNPSALENTTATIKAQKLIENGQVVILRDGKKFNALGAKL